MRNRVRMGMMAAVLIVVVLAIVTNNARRNLAILPEPGYQAPPFRLKSFSGPSRSLAQFRGRDVFINFWASWCPPCQAESPDLVRMYEKYGKQVVFLGINLTGSDTIQAAEGFIQYYHLPYTILKDVNNIVAKQYNVIAIPTSLFINREGMVVSRVTGGMTQAVMKQNFQALLDQK